MKWLILSSILICTVAVVLTATDLKQDIYDHLILFMRRFRPSALAKITATTTTTTNQSSAMLPASTFAGLPVVPPNDPSLTSTSPKPRGISKVFQAIEQEEGGGGARVRRSIGTPQLRNFSPFLLLDHFAISAGGGFGDHPLRGQETISYLLEGSLDHEDFAGNKGTLHEGDLQFMTAGKGIVHAEVPHDSGDGSGNVGLQLWVDLPKELKFCEPRYRDLRAGEIPEFNSKDGKISVKVISGQAGGVDSLQELAYTPVWYLDATIRPGGTLEQKLPAGWNAFAYILNGSVSWDTGATTQQVDQYHITVFEQKGDQVKASVPESAAQDTRLVIIAGMPLDQPIVQYGPFVLTDMNQVRQAMFDFQTHTNGFERAKDWESKIGKSVMI